MWATRARRLQGYKAKIQANNKNTIGASGGKLITTNINIKTYKYLESSYWTICTRIVSKLL